MAGEKHTALPTGLQLGARLSTPHDQDTGQGGAPITCPRSSRPAAGARQAGLLSTHLRRAGVEGKAEDTGSGSPGKEACGPHDRDLCCDREAAVTPPECLPGRSRGSRGLASTSRQASWAIQLHSADHTVHPHPAVGSERPSPGPVNNVHHPDPDTKAPTPPPAAPTPLP